MKLGETDLYYHDASAAERVRKFVETRCCHYQDRWAGEPFITLDYQRQFIHDVFGYKRRSDDLRRFREVYLESPKGNGKSPFLAALGLYMLMADGEQGAQVISAAADFQQANITFSDAKLMIQTSPRLQELVDAGKLIAQQYTIQYTPTNSVWRVMSGNFEGKAGFRPTCILLDEVWEQKNRKMFDSLTRNAKKRSQSLVIMATNSGDRKDTICWELHERAERVISGISKDDTLYPMVFNTPEDADPSSEATWKAANPALDKIITTETLRQEYAKAREVPPLLAEFRRLHCGQWVQGISKAFDMFQYAACERPVTAEDIAALPCILGLDPSLNDDLTALVGVWWDDETYYVRSWFWVPKATADEYQDKYSLPFSEWADANYINLTESTTIDPQTQRTIADFIIKLAATHQVKALCYDRNRGTNIVALAEDAGIVAVDVAQAFNLSAALQEGITRRLKDRTIVIDPNDVLRWNFSNAEFKSGGEGGVKLVKENAQGKYRGRSEQKIDGVSALATAIFQVRLEQMHSGPSVYETRGVFAI